MGEYSKRVGEQGEDYASTFLDLIGWKPRKPNFDLPCCISGHKNKKEHGVDGYFHYKSPLIDEVLDHVLISIKYSADGYGASPKSKFKSYLKDLQSSVECFDKSELKREANRSYLGVRRSSSYGLLIWFHGKDDHSLDIVSHLENVRFTDGFSITRPIYVLDKRRIKFISDSIYFIKSKYKDSKVDFLYQNTGNNLSAGEKTTNDRFIPIQMLSAGCLILRVQCVYKKEISVCICCDENFSKESLKKVIGLAQNLTLNIAASVMICFPDYQPEKHEGDVNDIKMLFDNRDFAETVNVQSLRLSMI